VALNIGRASTNLSNSATCEVNASASASSTACKCAIMKGAASTWPRNTPAAVWPPAGTRACLGTWGPYRDTLQFAVSRKSRCGMGINNALLVSALGGDDVASRVGHVAEEGVKEVIYELGASESSRSHQQVGKRRPFTLHLRSATSRLAAETRS
jgi:hypothetical protein